ANALLNWASEHMDALQAHSDNKGAILSRTGVRSVLPYMELAKELGILATVGRGMALTNVGRALVLLVPPQEDFSLRIEERLYFFFELLAHDRDIIWPLLVQLRRGKQRKRDVRREFPELYKN